VELLNGVSHDLTADQVCRRVRGVEPEPVHQYGVRIEGTLYPVKQAFEAATGIARRAFTSQTARRHLAALGFAYFGPSEAGIRVQAPAPPPATRASAEHGEEWHTEAWIQSSVVAYLVSDGWQITSVADTARRERGIDIAATRCGESLAIEVKGFPSRR
jgi:hypothetical protein